MTEESCLFCRIIDREIPAEIVHEDEYIVVFKDINPKAQVHLLVIPRQHVDGLDDINEEDHAQMMGYMMTKLNKIAEEHKLTNGYKVQINTGKGGGQEVFHLHLHVTGSEA